MNDQIDYAAGNQQESGPPSRAIITSAVVGVWLELMAFLKLCLQYNSGMGWGVFNALLIGGGIANGVATTLCLVFGISRLRPHLVFVFCISLLGVIVVVGLNAFVMVCEIF